jgi:hypothetical protein
MTDNNIGQWRIIAVKTQAFLHKLDPYAAFDKLLH